MKASGGVLVIDAHSDVHTDSTLSSYMYLIVCYVVFVCGVLLPACSSPSLLEGYCTWLQGVLAGRG